VYVSDADRAWLREMNIPPSVIWNAGMERVRAEVEGGTWEPPKAAGWLEPVVRRIVAEEFARRGIAAGGPD